MAAARQRAALVAPGRVPLVYLDANVLIPEYLRSVFLDLSHAGLIQAHWGKQVLVEVRRILSASHCNQFAASLAAAWGFTRG
ncbi:hypothetical protein C7T35_35255 [Variovorax sp. WS11]|uniref:hypothetical protein n=1 Tax=Variovorax sp. WS11 TaxID=1105204 RepID=UPI000D0D2D4C|nr:hypothetical protein [Variovorax sp. WS11]NDZ14461.1 hypothetical protein [Variovorax sp. WS11]PSL79899.1 hypothetical protein C7T35_35255 [Variovorax sp. WS11]